MEVKLNKNYKEVLKKGIAAVSAAISGVKDACVQNPSMAIVKFYSLVDIWAHITGEAVSCPPAKSGLNRLRALVEGHDIDWAFRLRALRNEIVNGRDYIPEPFDIYRVIACYNDMVIALCERLGVPEICSPETLFRLSSRNI